MVIAFVTIAPKSHGLYRNRGKDMKIKERHCITVGTNELTGAFAFCSVEHPENSFSRVLLSDRKTNDEIVYRWRNWRHQFEGNDSFNFVVVSSDVSHDVESFANRISQYFQPFVPYWVDLWSYVEGFCMGHGLESLYICNISHSVTPDDPLAEAVQLAKIWKDVQLLPGSYERLKREIDLDSIGFEIQLRGGRVSSNDCGIN